MRGMAFTLGALSCNKCRSDNVTNDYQTTLGGEL